jgi:iron complex transport system ATP-binding protein
LVRADNLRFRYGHRSRSVAQSRSDRFKHTPFIIDGVSLNVPRGAVVGVLGPNGSGKTTLLKLLSGALRPSEGQVYLEGQPLAGLSRRAVARRVAVVSQSTHLAFDYTALELVLMGRYPWLAALEVEGAEDVASAMEALGATGTRHLANRLFSTLSGGEQQRVVIASVLAQLDTRTAPAAVPPPALLLLDEPTASLDLKYQLEIGDLVRRLHDERGLTVIISTHDLRLTTRLCTWAVLLTNGQVLAEGPPGEILVPSMISKVYDIDARLAMPYLA